MPPVQSRLKDLAVLEEGFWYEDPVLIALLAGFRSLPSNLSTYLGI